MARPRDLSAKNEVKIMPTKIQLAGYQVCRDSEGSVGDKCNGDVDDDGKRGGEWVSDMGDMKRS